MIYCCGISILLIYIKDEKMILISDKSKCCGCEACMEICPQQYGITIWGVSDDPAEHENWLPDDAPNLWDASYGRKHAYKGVADGFAGKDVSEDFSGDLQY